MDRVAVLVDAGYFFAAGSALASGAGQQKRGTIIFDHEATVEALKRFAHTVTGGLKLLRVYWYDGALRRNGPSAEQIRLAHCSDVKIRLGLLNAVGQQKGVDSLIVTDLVELARNRAVADVVLMSGDEDVRIGVQIAQGFGVRVHLLGIEPCNATQSSQLRQEADTCSEWDRAVVSGLISFRPDRAAPPVPATAAAGAAMANVVKASRRLPSEAKSVQDEAVLNAVVDELFAELTPAEIEGAVHYLLATSNTVPYDIDGKLLARCRGALGRSLDNASRRYVRARARQRIREWASVAGPKHAEVNIRDDGDA